MVFCCNSQFLCVHCTRNPCEKRWMLGSGKWKRVSSNRLDSKEETATTTTKLITKEWKKNHRTVTSATQYRLKIEWKALEESFGFFSFSDKRTHTMPMPMPIVTHVRGVRKTKECLTIYGSNWTLALARSTHNRTEFGIIWKSTRCSLSMSLCQTKCDKEIHYKINYLINLIIGPNENGCLNEVRVFLAVFRFHFDCVFDVRSIVKSASVWWENICGWAPSWYHHQKAHIAVIFVFRFNKIDGP